MRFIQLQTLSSTSLYRTRHHDREARWLRRVLPHLTKDLVRYVVAQYESIDHVLIRRVPELDDDVVEGTGETVVAYEYAQGRVELLAPVLFAHRHKLMRPRRLDDRANRVDRAAGFDATAAADNTNAERKGRQDRMFAGMDVYRS